MWTLAAETSTPTGSLALLKNSDVHDYVDWPSERSHSEKITTESEALLKKNNLEFAQIDRYAVSTGPGSFTGIRVALNFVRTLSYTFDKPVLSVDSLYLLAAPALAKKADDGREVLAFQSAFRNLIYCARYKKNNEKVAQVLEPSALTVDETKALIQSKTLVLGRAFEAFKPVLDPDFLHFCEIDSSFSDDPHAKNFADVLSLGDTNSQILRWIDTKPLYIRASEAEEKLRQNVRK